jgi:hypothetical protein
MTSGERLQSVRVHRRPRLSQVALSALHGIYYAIMGALFALMLVLGIGAAVDGVHPTYWGTFTQHSCELGARGRCEPVGTWVSGRGNIVKRYIQLDGFVGSNGTVRASYTPTGFNNDAENNIVHVAATTGGRFWVPWVAALLIAGLVVFQSRQWRRKRNHHRSAPEHTARPG